MKVLVVQMNADYAEDGANTDSVFASRKRLERYLDEKGFVWDKIQPNSGIEYWTHPEARSEEKYAVVTEHELNEETA